MVRGSLENYSPVSISGSSTLAWYSETTSPLTFRRLPAGPLIQAGKAGGWTGWRVVDVPRQAAVWRSDPEEGQKRDNGMERPLRFPRPFRYL
uniref:Uncharacterized protein n=1 Tax=Anguilla anguilla TaxID=7936 RepID=A0A0E9SGZ7_ANGAN